MSGIIVDIVFLCVSALPCVPRFGYLIKDCYFEFTPRLLASLVFAHDIEIGHNAEFVAVVVVVSYLIFRH